MPMITCAVTDLPEPDSPRIAMVSPSARSKLMPCTALATPSRVRNSTWRSSTSRSGASGSSSAGRRSTAVAVIESSLELRVEGFADRVAEHDERENRQRQEQRREEHQE